MFSIPEYKCTGNALAPQCVRTPQFAVKLLLIVSFTDASANSRPTVATKHQQHHYVTSNSAK